MIGAARAIGPLSLGVRPHDVPPLASRGRRRRRAVRRPGLRRRENRLFALRLRRRAQGRQKSILVDIQAPWCPTCKAQKPILAEIEAKPEYKDLVVVHVDFDSQKDAVRRFDARMQSTLIAFKDGKETGRSVGQTDPAAIAALVAKAN